MPGVYLLQCDADMPDREEAAMISWYVPIFDGERESAHAQVWGITYTGLTRADYETAFRDGSMVRMSVWDRGYVVPDCPQSVIDGIERTVRTAGSEMSSLTEHQICAVLLAFVRGGITYVHDPITYGCKDYAASPTETVYLARGDCEDLSILYVSLLRAYGIRSTLITYDTHCMAGIWDDDYGGWRAVECTGEVWYKVWRMTTDDPGDGHVLTGSPSDAAVEGWLKMGAAFAPYNPILYIARMLSV